MRAVFRHKADATRTAVEQHQNKLRLRWRCLKTGERKNLPLGVEESTTGRAYAATIKNQIENDVKYGYYDSSLVKYRPKTIGKNLTEISTVELFDRFTKYQQKHSELSKASIDTRYKYLLVMLEKHLNIRAADVDKRAIDGFGLVCRKINPATAKQRIWLL